jgi:cytohesin
VVKALIEAVADVNTADRNGQTPLFTAANKGHEAVVKALVEAGADVNKVGGEYGATPLSVAVRNCHDAIARILRDVGTV